MRKPKNDYFVSLGDAAFTLGVLESDLLQWVKKDSPEVGHDYLNRKAIRKSYMERCAHKNDYLSKLKNSLHAEKKEIENESEETIQFYNNERAALIELYVEFIGDLKNLHQKYLKTVEAHGIENPVLAAYLLFSKAISTLSCLCDNLKNGYWYVGSMLREIDETLDVAHYFIINKDVNSNKTDLENWFRLGLSPAHFKCRKAIAKQYAQLDPSVNQKNHEMLMSSLYGAKSKFIHPTFLSIRDCSIITYQEKEVSIKQQCYGTSIRHKRLWELTHFSKSSIWTSFQLFMVIFIDSMPLDQRDIDYLLEYDNKFANLTDNLKW